MKASKGASRDLATIERALCHAVSYVEWLDLAQEHDQRSGAADWREDDHTDLLHVDEIRQSMARLRTLRLSGQPWPLSKAVQEVLFQHQGEFVHVELYHMAKTGTKRIVSEFLDEIEACIHFLINTEAVGTDDQSKLAQLRRISRIHGRPALLLSGSGALGSYHLGVVKALFEQDLLPRSISGSGMGSIIAAWVCTHNDAELREAFANPQLIAGDALRLLPIRQMLVQRSLFDQPFLLKCLQALIPDMTLAESKKHSRRILNISVCPYTTAQSARLLNYLSSPGVLIQQASVASCAIPGALSPMPLMARQRGEVVPWMEAERWVDGSLGNDPPFAQLSQALNINHFINAHMAPLQGLYGQTKGGLSALARMCGGIVVDGCAQALDTARKRYPIGPIRGLLSTLHGIVSPRHASSDMPIQLPFSLDLYPGMMQSPSQAQLGDCIRLGEQATWSQVPMIQDRTRISRLFGAGIDTLQQRIDGNHQLMPLRQPARQAAPQRP